MKQQTAVDPRTGRTARLFNPRTDRWLDHFRRSKNLLRIYGRTAIGRATVSLLDLNSKDEQLDRWLWREYLTELVPLGQD